MKKFTLPGAVLFLLFWTMCVCANVQDGFEFEINDEGAVIYSCSIQDKDITIPGVLGDSPVVGIADEAFAGNRQLEQLTMPASITFIGDRAFADCSQLQILNISSGLQRIGQEAFLNCTGLLSIMLPAMLEQIERRAFAGCENLSYLYDNTSGNLTDVGRGAFDDTAWFKNFRGDYVTICQGCLLLQYRGEETNLVLPWDIVCIAEDAFSGNESVASLKLPNFVTELREGSISDMTSLTSVFGGSGLTAVSEHAFRNLPKLRSVMLETVELGAENFEDCPLSPYGFESTAPYDLTLPDEADVFFETEFDENLGGVVITHCRNEAVFPDGVVVIPDHIRNKRVTAIGAGACQDRADIEKLILPKYLAEIRSWAFSFDVNLAEVEFPERLQRIEADAFNNCAIAAEEPDLPDVDVDPRAFYRAEP